MPSQLVNDFIKSFFKSSGFDSWEKGVVQEKKGEEE